MSVVLNTSSHVVDLHDGRSIGPGEWADNVDLGEVHNARLAEDGLIHKLDRPPVDSPRPSDATPHDAAEAAATAAAQPVVTPGTGGTETGGNA